MVNNDRVSLLAILESDGLWKSIRVGRKFAKISQNLLDERNSATAYLYHMVGIGLWNKHYMHLRHNK